MTIATLDTVVVTPERSARSTRTSTVAVSVISGEHLRRLPLRSVAASLAMTPGVAVVDVNSIGGSPRIIVRGFYGGGETDYLPALIDGVPIAALGSGAVNWEMLSRAEVGRLEVVRGGSSYIRGDAAVAGALNLLTEARVPSRSWRLAGGSHGIRDATLSMEGAAENHRAGFTFDHSASRGYRAHEERKASTLNAKLARYGATGIFNVFGLTHFRDFDDPGPLPSTIVDRRANNPFFRFDRGSERVHRGGVSVTRAIGPVTGSGYVVGEYATARTTRTLPLSPDFADTKLRRTDAPRLLASTQFEFGDDSAGSRGRVVAGLDGSVGRFTSRYADVASGSLSDYSAAAGDAQAPGQPSRTTRKAGSAFAYWQLRPFNPLRFALSTRFDHLRDATQSRAGGIPSSSASHDAFSPRAALNLELPASRATTTNAYFSVGRVFKAPTLDQLFDDRAIPVPFPPFSTTISNASLGPQRGTALETGFYSAWLVRSGARLDISASAYRERMRDELDFDVTSFRYINLGRSLHRGLEFGTSLTTARGTMLFANLSRQRALAESGPFEGRQLKAIPRSIASAGADLRLWRGLSAGFLVTSVGGAFVDDANATPLPGYSRGDLRLGVPTGPLRLTLDVMNALGRRYDATAFPDPAGSTTSYRYPAAGRIVVLGLESR